MKKFAAAMTVVGTVFDEPISTEKVKAYWMLLCHYGEDKLVWALQKAAQRYNFFPKPAEIIQIVEGEAEDTEEEATAIWAELRSNLSDITKFNQCANRFNDPRVQAGLDALGWWHGIVYSSEEPHWQLRTFRAAFCGKQDQMAKEKMGLPPGDSPVAKLIEDVSKKIGSGDEND